MCYVLQTQKNVIITAKDKCNDGLTHIWLCEEAVCTFCQCFPLLPSWVAVFLFIIVSFVKNILVCKSIYLQYLSHKQRPRSKVSMNPPTAFSPGFLTFEVRFCAFFHHNGAKIKNKIEKPQGEWKKQCSGSQKG